MNRLHPWILLALALGLSACDGGPTAPAAEPVVETLAELPNAPTEVVDGRMTCIGKGGVPGAAGALEVNGYVRTLADPEAKKEVPAAKVEVFLPDGTSIGTGFADSTKAGRVAISVPVKATGFEGYSVVSQGGFLDWRLSSSRPITTTDIAGWAWLSTQDEINSRAKALGFELKAGTGILVGAVHDCDGFGVANAVVVVGSSSSNLVYYMEGFDIAAARPYTSLTGRFVTANLPAGELTVKAFGRLKASGPLTLLSSAKVTIEAGRMTAIDLAPREGLK